jgi:hypothetical protein
VKVPKRRTSAILELFYFDPMFRVREVPSTNHNREHQLPNSRKIIAQSVFTIGIAGSIPKQDCIRQTFGPKLVEICRHKPLCPARDRADRRPSSLCTTFNLPIEDQAPVYDGSVTLGKRANINGTELRIPRHGDDACEDFISVPPRALD